MAGMGLKLALAGLTAGGGNDAGAIAPPPYSLRVPLIR